MKSLTPQQQRIFTAAQHQAHRTSAELAKKLGMKETSVRNGLSKLTNAEVIFPTYVFDLSALGRFTCAIMFSLDAESHKRRAAIQSYLSKHPQTVYFNELGGEFEYVVSIATSGPADVQQFLFEFSTEFETSFTRKQIAFRAAVTLFGRRYFDGDWKLVKPIHYGITQSHETLDKDDIQVLHTLVEYPDASASAIGRTLNKPTSSVNYRIKKLYSSGVIKGKIYGMQINKLGIGNYRLLLTLDGCLPELRKQLMQLCKKSRCVSILVESIGSWDFEHQLEVHDESEISAFRNELWELFGSQLEKVQVLPTLKQIRPFHFPVAYALPA